MKLYLCGPMSGCPDHNFPAFNKVAAYLRNIGNEVVNPAELDDGDTSKCWDYYMRRDVPLLLDCDAVVLLAGWYSSNGAIFECLVAAAFDLPFWDIRFNTPREIRGLLAENAPFRSSMGGDTTEKFKSEVRQSLASWFGADLQFEKSDLPDTTLPPDSDEEEGYDPNLPAPGQSEDEETNNVMLCTKYADFYFGCPGCYYERCLNETTDKLGGLVEHEFVSQDDYDWLHWVQNQEFVNALNREPIDRNSGKRFLVECALNDQINKLKAKVSVCEEADSLVCGQRGGSYGHPIEDFSRTAKLWGAILGIPVTPQQVGLCMTQVKVSRECHAHKRDNLVDIAGYAQTVQMIEDKLNGSVVLDEN